MLGQIPLDRMTKALLLNDNNSCNVLLYNQIEEAFIVITAASAVCTVACAVTQGLAETSSAVCTKGMCHCAYVANNPPAFLTGYVIDPLSYLAVSKVTARCLQGYWEETVVRAEFASGYKAVIKVQKQAKISLDRYLSSERMSLSVKDGIRANLI
ncbi:MAG: hypothetical protein PHO32_08575 [Candidatus Cloacimonetes bacterium]|nr:hypothetical protein [Candidatus Cloacimonadota bacterium]